MIPPSLTPASGRQDHTTSPSASAPFVFGATRVHRTPPPTSVTIAKRPSVWDGMISLYSCFYQTGKRKIFANRTGHGIAKPACRANHKSLRRDGAVPTVHRQSLLEWWAGCALPTLRCCDFFLLPLWEKAARAKSAPGGGVLRVWGS